MSDPWQTRGPDDPRLDKPAVAPGIPALAKPEAPEPPGPARLAGSWHTAFDLPLFAFLGGFRGRGAARPPMALSQPAAAGWVAWSMRLVSTAGLVLHTLLLAAAPAAYLAREELVGRFLEPDPAAVERAVRALEARLAASGPSASDPEVAALLGELRAAERGRFRAAAARQFLNQGRWLLWIAGNSLTALPLHVLLLAAARRLARAQAYAVGLARRAAGLQIARLLLAATAYIVWIAPEWVDAEAWAFAAAQEPARAAELASRYAAWLGWVQVLAVLGVVLVACLPAAAWLAGLPTAGGTPRNERELSHA